ncbi:MAG: hypothetical protein M3384_08615 [Acidobacteriota bacterium]|nr:hypothetical protein [Acidobacteriota bacterium]
MSSREKVQELVNLLGEKKYEFLNDVEKSIENYVSNQGSNCLTIVGRYPSGVVYKRWYLSASLEYIRCLVAFCRQQKFQGKELDSGLTDPISNIVSKRFESFYEQNAESISQTFLKYLVNEKVMLRSIVSVVVESAAAKFAKDRTIGLMAQPITAGMKSKVTDLIISQMHHVVHSTTAQTVMTTTKQIVGAALTIPVAKTVALILVKLLASHMAIIIAKILSSAAIKTLIATVVKKFILAAILAAIAKAVAAKFGIGVVGATAIVLLPVVAAFIAYEIYTFPSHLGAKVASKVSSELSNQFDTINTNIAQEIFSKLPELTLTELAENLANSDEVQNEIHKLFVEVARA